MFTINIYLKFALIALFLLGGVGLAFAFGFWYAFPFLLIGLGLLVSYIMLGTIQSAAQMVQKQDFDGAEQRLGLTWKPKYLYVTNRAFYYILKGSILMNKKDHNGAELLFEEALKIKLPSDNEKGMILLQLANINGSKNKWTAAKNHFRDLKKLKITEPQLKEQVDMFEKALQNSGQSKVARSMGKQGMQMMQGRSSKRRRPKMR